MGTDDRADVDLAADGNVAAMIDADLVARLVRDQFPAWADLAVSRVPHDGWDNRTFRLGEQLTVRLPSAAGYVPQIAKEQRWLPYLAPRLPLPIPVPLGLGVPGQGFPYPWSVSRWLDGTPAVSAPVRDLVGFAADLADFLVALRRLDASGGPAPGLHSGHRGGPLGTYDVESWRAIATLGDRVDRAAAAEVWRTAMAAEWTEAPVWFHGDIAVGNLLVHDDRLCAVIDFGSSGVGDPACDAVIAWTLFSGLSRTVFLDRLGLDAAAIARGRGWAIWKALITLAGTIDSEPAAAAESRLVIDRVIVDHSRGRSRSARADRA